MINTRELLRIFNIRAKKEYGQNFLTDENTADMIISCADITKSDLIIEIGPGAGSLTQKLCSKAGYVAAVEIDRNMEAPLKFVLDRYDNYTIIFDDIMDIDINRDVIGRFKTDRIDYIKIVANLPYYVATHIITKLLSRVGGISKMILMVQKEVAQRICSGPNGKEYGVLSIAVQIYADAHIAFDVSSESFLPPPKVDSSIVVLDIFKTIPYDIPDIDFFFMIVKAAFSQRRKTISNSLYARLKGRVSKQTIDDILVSIGEDPKVRAERISIPQFCELAKKLIPLC